MDAVGEIVLSSAIELLLKKLMSSDLIRFASQQKVYSELKKWEKNLLIVNEVVNDAEEKQMTSPAVKTWLRNLRDWAYDAEDVLDDFATELLLHKLMAEGAETGCRSQVRGSIPNCCTCINPCHVRFNVKMGSKVKEITKRLEELSIKNVGLGLLKVTAELGLERVDGPNSTLQRLPTTCLINEPVHGRDDDKKIIVDLLLKDEACGSNFGVIPIVGIGGMGKTTLAQFVYRDDDIVKHFGSRAWVCVSDESNVEKLTKKILNAFSPDEIRDGDDFNQVQLKLSDNMAGKRFLLVLDDVWNIKSYEQWSQLRVPFKSGARGSKIIVTTRDTNVASVMRVDNYHHFLRPLSKDDCWSVFLEHAFEIKNVDEHPDMKSIGEEIVQKCSGLPLAAKMVGGLLRSKFKVEAWKRVLNSNIWNNSEYGIMPILRLSYQHLSPHLKRCFAYCALFPRDYEFEQKQLILLWMAEGLIHQAKEDNRQMEDIGADYFNELLARCFFQQLNNYEFRFVMHDLINDLAKDVATEMCFNLENVKENCKSTRHLSFVHSEYDVFTKFEVCDQVEQLRTFLALPINTDKKQKCYLSTKVFHELLPKLKCLRVLSLSCYEINELPDSIGDLKHLRYLNLSYTALKLLPEAINGLYNLQSLILCNCRKLIRLPMGIGNLINLRHLDINGLTLLKEMPPQVGNLINLQTLSKFFLSQGTGSRIRELKKLLNLRGELAILGLENVVDPRDAMYVNLKERPSIEDLILLWNGDFGYTRNGSNEMEVLQWLQPHESLTKLTIGFYGGTVFPTWIGDPSFSKVVQLRLIDCKKCTLLPPLGRLALLKNLEIEGLNEIRSIGDGFYGEIAKPFGSLEYLRFQDMLEWKDWVIPKLGCQELFPCLRELVIIKCPKLSTLPDQFPSLVNLNIKECQELTISIPRFPFLSYLNVTRCNEEMFKSGLIDVPSLTQLFIEETSKLSCLWGGLAQPLTALEDLGLYQCDELACLRGLENIYGLQRLWILECDGVVSLEEQSLPCNLRYLYMKECSKLEKLPNALHTLTSLKDLGILNCPKLMSFPETGLPPMLRLLLVKNCKGLKMLPDGMMINNCALEHLEIEACPSLIGLPNELSTTLKNLIIKDCEKLESLPKGIMHRASMHSNSTCSLEVLYVQDCSSLKSIPRGEFPSTLRALTIWKCKQLESIPGKMLQNLTSLRTLSLCNCPDVMSSPEAFWTPNLKRLSISDSENMKKIPLSAWGLHTFTSVEEISIRGPFLDVISFSVDGFQLLPMSLITLSISNFQNLKSIASMGLQSLVSLRTLELFDCPKLRSFVPKEGLPPTVGRLVIRGCPILTKRCLKDKGKCWPKIAHIPCVEIDDIVQV